MTTPKSMTPVPSFTAEQRRADEPGMEIGMNGSLQAQAPSVPTAFPFSFGSRTLPGLAKLAEEAGEVGQVIGKLMMTGGARGHWDGTDLIDRLQEEIADLFAATMFVAEHCDLDHSAIFSRAEKKHRLFEQWHREQAQEASTGGEGPSVGTKPKAECTQ